MSKHIFLSVGQTATLEQQQFVEACEQLLIRNGLTPRTVGRTDFVQDKPLKRIKEVMLECSGTIIIALERLHIHAGLELRNGENEVALVNCNIPTVWTQIEAAMAYTLGHPLLAIVESGLRPEGFLEEGYEWYIEWLDLNPRSLREPTFLEAFNQWQERVELFAG